MERTIRQHATKIVLPEFPQEAVNNGASGVAVAEVVLSAGGLLQSIKILQAPDPLLAQSTEAAIRQWTFKATAAGEDQKVCLKGRLTFYFVVEANRAYSRNPGKFTNSPI